MFKQLDELENERFNIIALWDVIEHLEDPKKTLLTLSKYLTSDGYFVIETSNIDSIDYLITKSKWSYWHIDHYFYYSYNSLKYLLHQIGFELVDLSGSGKEILIKKRKTILDYLKMLNFNTISYEIKKLLIKMTHNEASQNSLMILVARRKD
ncbi:MAG: class I SAM-dependent methyltransferase [Saprospiraceae bacterium]|nr:class I SAM-dependent methyltransferase [Saprospiraceae bacterium]